MARQALTVVGAIVGGIYGGGPQGAQIGAAIGGLVGGIIDPQVTRIPSSTDVAVQKLGEGFPIPQYDGTAGGAGVLVYVSEPDFVDVEEGGKGGEPATVQKRTFISYAVLVGMALGDGPGHRNGIPYLLRAWEDEVLVYDVTPGSQIVAESAKYAETFSWLPGTLTQEPDPDLEAIEGAGNVSAYRGRAVFIKHRMDVTDRRGTPPSMRFEVATTSDSDFVAGTWWLTGISPGQLWIGNDPADFSDAVEVTRSPNAGTGSHGTDGGGYYRVNESMAMLFQAGNPGQYELIFDGLAVEDTVTPVVGDVPFAATGGAAFDVIVIDGRVFIWSSNFSTFYVFDSNTYSGGPVTWEPHTMPNGWRPRSIAKVGTNLAALARTGSNGGLFYANSYASTINWQPASTPFVPNGENIHSLGGSVGVINIGSQMLRSVDGALSWNYSGSVPDSDFYSGMGCMAHNGAGVVIASDDNATKLARSDDNGVTWASVPGVTWGATRIEFHGDKFVASAPGEDGGIWIAGADGESWTQAILPGGVEPGFYTSLYMCPINTAAVTPAGYSSLARVIRSTGRRCLMPDSIWNLPGLDDVPIRGIVAASQGYTGQDLINGLRYVKPSDGACFDGKIHILLRGGAVDLELDEEFLVDEDSDLEQEETLQNGDDRQTTTTRLPAKFNVMFPNARLGYQLTKATSPNYGENPGTVRELTVEVPVVLDEETEAPALADILDKIANSEASGELVRLFPDYLAASVVPGTIVRLKNGALQRRTRAVTVRAGEGTRRLGLAIDRVRDYSSQQTAPQGPAWPTPPPSLVGTTTFAVMNLPALTDAQASLLGVVGAISGSPGTAWYGAKIQWRVQGTTNWNDLGSYTTRTVMGTLIDAFPAGAEAYVDPTNELRVRLLHDDDLESLSYVDWLSERGALAIVRADGTAEIVQPRFAENDTGQDWTLRYHQRGRLATSAAAHSAGARVVQLARAIFLPLPSSAMGKTLEFRAISLGETAETATVVQLDWSPAVIQQEFPVAHLRLTRAGGTIEGSWIERRRIGTDVTPIRTLNWQGYRVTLTDGSTNETFDTTETSFSRSDSAFSGPVTVTVQQINLITGPGPGTSSEIA